MKMLMLISTTLQSSMVLKTRVTQLGTGLKRVSNSKRLRMTLMHTVVYGYITWQGSTLKVVNQNWKGYC